jgi:ABC-type transport system involved in multi-copper enzyme maturation permease subunit
VVLFTGSSLVHKEIDRRTIYILLSKPVRRFEFLLGKFVGMAATLAAVTALMLAVLLALLAATGSAPDGGVALAAGLVGVELVVMAAVALLFSTFTTPALSAVFTLALYVAGHLSGDLLDFAKAAPNAANRFVAEALYAVLPNLDVLNVRAEVVHGVAIEPARVLLAVSYALLYTAGVLAAASLILSRRDFR